MLAKKVKRTVARYEMLPGGRVVIAVSGGVDSVVLLDILCRLLPRKSLIIAHLDHGIRGEAARADARFVKKLGDRLGIPVITGRADVPRLSRDQGINLEEAGRRVRRRFLEQVAKEAGATRIALGHTRDDLVETVLFHLTRGAGPTGLSGIRPVTLPYIRPLIEATRTEILAYAHDHSLSWHEDETNKDVQFTRNLMRHRVVPLLERVNPRVRDAIARTAEILCDEEEAVRWLLDPVWNEITIEGEPVTLDRTRLASLPAGVQGLILRRGIKIARGELTGIEKVHIDGLRRLIASSRPSGELHLPGICAYMENDRLLLSTKRSFTPLFSPAELKLGRTELPDLGIALTLVLEDWNNRNPPADSAIEAADADMVEFPLEVRTRRPGDRFQPLGMSAGKKLKDFLIDQKVPFSARDRVPLLCDKQGIIWVVGIRLAERVKVTDRTKSALLMRVEELS